ncbi:MAG: hypothetical protein JWM10_1945 [Myxococcaceae bacterium]|nr:hypothetical protein [Myxococcaceae bacterium]
MALPSPDRPTTTADPKSPAGVVHSLAYTRYAGARRSPAFAPLVIARYALMAQLRQRGVKVALLLGLVSLAVCAAILGAKWSLPTMAASAGFGELGGAGQLARAVRDGEADVLVWALRAQILPTFLLTLWCGAGAVSADLMAGAFQFHFSRPVSPGGYLAGRVVSASGWALCLSAVTLLVFSVERLAFQSTPLGAARALGLGAVAVLLELSSLAAVALGVSSLTRRKGLAQAMFAAIAFAGWVLCHSLGALLGKEWVKSLDLISCVDGVVAQLNHQSTLHGGAAFVPALAWLGWTAGALALAAWQLSRAEVNRG